MAIKGKRKSQNRGSQARRRPAMAPRPATTRIRKVPWYKTTAGQTIAAIGTMIALVVGLVLWNDARQEAEQLEASRSRLETYTDQVSALQQRLSEPVTAIAGVVPEPPDDLADLAAGWRETFTGAQTEVAQFIVLEEDALSGQLFTQAINLFRAASESAEVAAGLDARQQTDLLSAVSTQVQSAVGVWEAGVDALDAARGEVDLNASGIDSPLETAAPPVPAGTPDDSATIPVETGGGGGGKGRGGGGGGRGDDADD